MNKAYSRINWQNQPNTSTALGATNLNKMDIALNSIDDRVITLDTTKLDLTTANSMVKSFSLNQSTGVITITLLDGTVTTYDTKLEKLAVNFAYDATAQQLVITLDDGTKQYVDMSALITQYEFSDSSTVGFSVDSNGKVSASVKNGSITAEQLQPNYLADITTQQQTATAQAKLAKRYAVGGVETGDTTDNAKYYKEQAELFKTQAKQYRDEAQDISNVGIAGESKLGLVKGDGNVEIESDGDMWADPYKDKGTVTGTFINFKSADDALAQINIKGATTVTPVNPDLPISPDNKATLVSAQNFDLVSCSDNMLDFSAWKSKTNVVKGTILWDEVTKSVTLTATGTDCYTTHSASTASYRIYVAPNTTYTLSWDYVGEYGLVYIFYNGISSGVGVMESTSNANKKLTFTTKSDTTFIVFRVGVRVDGTSCTYTNLKLEKGNIVTPHTVYKEDRINIPYELGEWNNIKDNQYINGGVEVVFDGSADESISIYGTNTTGKYRIGFSPTIKAKPVSKNSTIPLIYCDKFKAISPDNSYQLKDGITVSTQGIIYFYYEPISHYTTIAEVRAWLALNPITVRYESETPIITPLNTYLKTFKGITNIFTNATPQPEITATFKPQLWADLYNHQNAINSKIDKDKIGKTFLSDDWESVAAAPLVKQLKNEIDITNNNIPKQINYWSDTQLNLLKKINDVSDTTFRTVIINGWDSVFTDADMPYRNTVWHIALYNNGRDINIWQRWTNLDNGQVYIRLYKPSSNSWGGDWISNDLKQTADLLPEADILAANSSVYPSMASKIGNVVTLSFLFKKRDGSNFTVGQNVLLAKIPSGYTTTTNLCTSGLGSMTEDLSSPDTTKPQSIVFWNNGIFAHIAHETKVIGGSITYFI